jgi:Lrp/AsnC family transcriptional regulator
MFQLASRDAPRRPEAARPMLDEMDVKILKILQHDCTRSVADIGREVGLSTTPCWRRIQKLEEAGVVRRRVAILDAGKVNAGVTVFVSIKTDQHSLAWLERFHAAVVDFPEVVEFYRMSGEVDYLLRVVVPDIAAYDGFYKKLISKIEISKVSSAFAMEQIKYTTALPLDFALPEAEAKAPRKARA